MVEVGKIYKFDWYGTIYIFKVLGQFPIKIDKTVYQYKCEAFKNKWPGVNIENRYITKTSSMNTDSIEIKGSESIIRVLYG